MKGTLQVGRGVWSGKHACWSKFGGAHSVHGNVSRRESTTALHCVPCSLMYSGWYVYKFKWLCRLSPPLSKDRIKKNADSSWSRGSRTIVINERRSSGVQLASNAAQPQHCVSSSTPWPNASANGMPHDSGTHPIDRSWDATARCDSCNVWSAPLSSFCSSVPATCWRHSMHQRLLAELTRFWGCDHRRSIQCED